MGVVKKLTKEELDRLIDEPIYSWDVRRLLGGIIDFLDFTEGQLAWQRRGEIRKAAEKARATEFEPPDEALNASYKDHLIEAAQYRFDAGLCQNVRYSGFIAYIGILDLCSVLFSKRCATSIPTKPRGKSEAAHVFSYLNEQCGCGLDAQLKEFQDLVFVRNCIAHTSGLVDPYKHAHDLRRAATTLRGISLRADPVLGERVYIDKGAVEGFASEALKWVPFLDKACTEKAILK